LKAISNGSNPDFSLGLGRRKGKYPTNPVIEDGIFSVAIPIGQNDRLVLIGAF
jgi:hypothetical protein